MILQFAAMIYTEIRSCLKETNCCLKKSEPIYEREPTAAFQRVVRRFEGCLTVHLPHEII